MTTLHVRVACLHWSASPNIYGCVYLRGYRFHPACGKKDRFTFIFLGGFLSCCESTTSATDDLKECKNLFQQFYVITHWMPTFALGAWSLIGTCLGFTPLRLASTCYSTQTPYRSPFIQNKHITKTTTSRRSDPVL